MCQVRLPSSALAEALMPLFTIHGSRQANGNQVTWTSCNQKEVLKPGATGRVCRLNSSQPAAAKVVFSLSLSLSLSLSHTHTHSQHCDSSVAVQGKGGWQKLLPQKPSENTPFTPSARSDQPTFSRGNHSTHTPFLPDHRACRFSSHHRTHTHTHTHTLTQRGDRFCEYLRVPIGQQQGCVT